MKVHKLHKKHKGANAAAIRDISFAVEPGQTAASFNAQRMPGARYTKSFNTLTSGFQAEAAARHGDE